MNTKTARAAPPAKKPKYNSSLRQEQAKLTVKKIQDALLELFQNFGNAESLTYKVVAAKAGVTEVTVYRYFPQRADLLKALWERINQNLGDEIHMPQDFADLLRQNPLLHQGFSKNSTLATASLFSPQGREMRTSLNAVRQAAFLKIVRDLNPQLSLPKARRKAAILQLLHSAYAWDSLQLQWEMSGEEIAATTQEALEIFLQHTKKARNV